jgi:hypothetical protein
MHSNTSKAAIAAKKMRNPGGQCTSVGPAPPRNRRLALSLTPSSYLSGTLQTLCRAAHLAECLCCRCTAERTNKDHHSAARADGSMAQTCRCVVFTWNLAPGVFERCHPVRFITGHGTNPMPGECPRVDEPHPASIACARPPVAGRARKCFQG